MEEKEMEDSGKEKSVDKTTAKKQEKEFGRE